MKELDYIYDDHDLTCYPEKPKGCVTVLFLTTILALFVYLLIRLYKEYGN